tara:strand:+ start:2084 stop:3166 length:1083 start_codon:yes stop_codon:yes gene_type:complete
MILKNYQKYLIKVFISNFALVALVFFSLSFVLNIFEEIKYFENINVNIFFPLLLTLLNTPSILLELLPFIFLISSMFFFIFLYDRDELEILVNNGINYLKVVIILSLLSFIIGLITILFYYTFSAKLKSHYLIMKNKFSTGNEYLAIVNDSGLWIKEEVNGNINIINAQKFKQNTLENITITQVNKEFKTTNTVISTDADISKKLWKLNNVKMYVQDGTNKTINSYNYKSFFNGEMIANLFSNLNSLNLFELHQLSENYAQIGYSTTDVKVHLNKIYSLPIYILLMTIIGALMMIRLKFLTSKFFTLIIGVFISVVVYYLNYFSSLFGLNEMIPLELSVWLPIILLLLICSIGIVRINEL